MGRFPSYARCAIVAATAGLAWAAVAPAWGQACFQGDGALAEAFAAARKANPQCTVRCRGCGCQGGPGWRGPDGECVGYGRLEEVCGPPEERARRCTAECAPVVASCSGISAERAATLGDDVAARAGCGEGRRRTDGMYTEDKRGE